MGGTRFTVRRYEPQDLEFVTDLIRLDLKRFFDDTPEGWSEQKLKNVDPERVRVLLSEQRRAGFIDYGLSDRYGRSLYLHNLHISKKYRGKGAGTYCLNDAEQAAKYLHVDLLFGKVFWNNEHSLDWLMRRGFVIDHILPAEESFMVVKEVYVGE